LSLAKSEDRVGGGGANEINLDHMLVSQKK